MSEVGAASYGNSPEVLDLRRLVPKPLLVMQSLAAVPQGWPLPVALLCAALAKGSAAIGQHKRLLNAASDAKAASPSASLSVAC
jgi:hypothetical protein